jgi:hypothetical protein
MDNPRLTYTPHPDATPEAQLKVLANVYRYVLFDSQASKGGPHDVATDGRKQKVQGKKGQNMTLWVAETYESLPAGLYVGELLDIESRESANGQYRRWCWEILEGPYAGRKVYANTSTNFGPQAKPRQWVENILGRELEAGEQIGIEDLVGGKHHLMVENVKRDGRTFDNVSAVHKYQE